MLNVHFFLFFALNFATISLGCYTTNSAESSLKSNESTPSYRPNSNSLCTSDGYVLIGSECEECGLSDFEQNAKIVGGIEAIPQSIPSQIFFKQTYSYLGLKFQYLCGGTLIRPNVVLTAAHCINTRFYISNTQYIPYTQNNDYPNLESTFDVYAGLHDQSTINNNGDASSPAVRVKVSKIKVHESFSLDTMLNDIALLFLEENLTLNSYVKLACLPSESTTYPPINEYVWASGWGTLSSGSSISSSVLNIVKLTNYDSSKCSDVLTTLPKNWDNQICAGEYAGGKDTCQGDSGGPLMSKQIIDGKLKMFVSGITSYGFKCAIAKKPGIYTRTSAYKSWILSNIKL